MKMHRLIFLLFTAFMYLTLTGCGPSPAQKAKRKATKLVMPPPNFKSFKICFGEMAIYETSFCKVIIDITEIGKSHAKYRWRYRDKAFNGETTGQGEVTEKLKKVVSLGNNSLVKDTGSDNVIKAGKIACIWSPCNNNSCWLYYNPAITTTRTISNKNFNSYDLKEK